MEYMTAEQAAEAAKGLTFEKVWAALMEMKETQLQSQLESQKQIAESQKRMEESHKRLEKSHLESQKRMEESHKQLEKSQLESQKQLNESQKQLKESQKKTDKIIADLSKNIGGLGNSLGRFTESMFSTELWKKFNEIGFTFSRQAPHVKFIENGSVLAEVDFFLEDGIYAMLVEVKTELSLGGVDEHLDRMEKIRHYMDARNDGRKILGAVAGGIVSDNVLKYAQNKGLFVIVQTGDSVAIAAMPQNFKAREW